MAEELNIDPTKYPLEHIYFPTQHFKAALTSDMTVAEVHRVIRGYKDVYRCGNDVEIYYYFSGNDREALRFEILYRPEYNRNLSSYGQMKFSEIRVEDSNSGYISIRDCKLGLLHEDAIYEIPSECRPTQVEDNALRSLVFGSVKLEEIRALINNSPFKEAHIQEDIKSENNDQRFIVTQNGINYYFYFENGILNYIRVVGETCGYTID